MKCRRRIERRRHSSWLSRHLPARLRTAAAGFRAFLAVLHVMLGAFVSARLADFRTKRAGLCRKFRAACHETRSHRTDGRARAIQLDATCHHFSIVFLKTRCGALLTSRHARITFVDTALIFFVGHPVGASRIIWRGATWPGCPEPSARHPASWDWPRSPLGRWRRRSYRD